MNNWGIRLEDRVAAPAAINAIDEGWLTQALAANHPGTEVTSVMFGREVHATGTKIRLLLDYNEAGHHHRLPATMWFKGGYEPHSHMVRMSHVSETLFYRNF